MAAKTLILTMTVKAEPDAKPQKHITDDIYEKWFKAENGKSYY